MAQALTDKEAALMDAYWRAANYLSVGQIYLYDNPLLKKPSAKEHIKPRLLGHWGTTPGARVDRVIARARAAEGDVALFAHGHVLRVLAARWIGLPATAGQHFLLNTGTLSVLGYYREIPAVRIWNGPLPDPTGALGTENR
jgi:broad specificity phosphatase PhoE